MDIARAKELITVLADGINPITGEVLGPDDSCNQPDVIRALHCLLGNLKSERNRSLPENAGKPWYPEDDEQLIRMFDAEYKAKEICDHFKRTKGSIAARLVKLGKINFRDEFSNS